MVVNKQNQTKNLINSFEVSLIRQFLNLFIYKILRCKKANADARNWEGNQIFVERAAEPGDIYWENLSVNTIKRVKKTLITYTIASLCLGVAFSINLALSFAKDALDKYDDVNSGVWAVTGLLSL